MSKSVVVNFLFVLFYSMTNYAQAITLDKILETNIESFSYPFFLSDERHEELLLTIGNFEKLKIEVQAFYNTYLLENRARGSIIIKPYFNNNVYGLVSSDVEWREGVSLVPINRPPRVGIGAGFGYEIENSFSLELKSNFATNKEAMGAFGEPFIPMPQLHTVKGKIKF